MTSSPEYRNGLAFINGLSHVYHCNHYNAHLQMSVLLGEGMEDGFNPRELLKSSAADLTAWLRRHGLDNRELLAEFTHCGFGIIKQTGPQRISTPHSHYGQSTYAHGRPEKSCYFNAGFLQGLTGRTVEETSCRHEGADIDTFEAGVATPEPGDPFREEPSLAKAPPRFAFDGCEVIDSPVDEDKIISTVATLPLYGRPAAEQGDGLIPAFGVVLTNHYADYYNRISYETYRRMVTAGVPPEMAREAFVQCGHVCAFNTFGGIMESPEWYGLVEPMCASVEDWVHGMVAVINALGWGVWRVEKLVPGEELIVRIYNSYEGVGYRRLYPQTDERQLSFLALGAVRGLAHLFWKIDIRERPGLGENFYFSVFNNPEGYWNVEQTHAIAAGDAYDRIVTTR